MDTNDLFELNRRSWNQRTEAHLRSDWYGHDAFRAGATSLKEIELALLGDVSGQRILHLQCHFGQDTISLARMGASAIGVDIADKAIEAATTLAKELEADARFIRCNLYDLEDHLDETFDRVFVTYGAIGWLPDLERWAKLVARYLKPGGELILVEFHPFVWTFDDDVKALKWDYDSREPIIEEQDCTYASSEKVEIKDAGWNHGLGYVISSILDTGLQLTSLREFDWSPYDCFPNTVEFEPGKFRIGHIKPKIPMVYALTARANGEQ